MPVNEIWSVIRSMIFHSAAVSGFRPRLSSSGLLRMLSSVREGLFGPCCKLSHLNCSTDLLRTPTALINSVSSAYIAFFLLLVIRLLCFYFRISCFFSIKSVYILISAKDQLQLLSLFEAIFFSSRR